MPTIIVVESQPSIRRDILQATSQAVPGWNVESVAHLDMAVAPSRGQGYELMLLSVRSIDDVYQMVTLAKLTYMPKNILLLSDDRGLAPWAQGLPPGVVGCVPTDAPSEMLQASIRLVLAGGMYFPARVARKPPAKDYDSEICCSVSVDLPCRQQESEALGLTPRQYEVLVLLARGHTLKAIGRHLNIAVATAKVHAETVYQRLQVHNRNEAVYAAITRGATLGWPAMVREAAVQA